MLEIWELLAFEKTSVGGRYPISWYAKGACKSGTSAFQYGIVMKYAEQCCSATALNIKRQLWLALIPSRHPKKRSKKECALFQCLTNGWSLALGFA